MALVSALSPIGSRAGSVSAKACLGMSVGASALPAVDHNEFQGCSSTRGHSRRARCCMPQIRHNQSNRLVHSPSRRPVRHSSSRIGLHFPAERHRAARGGFSFRQLGGSSPFVAQSVRYQPPVNVAVAVVVHLGPYLSKGAAVREISCEPKGFGNVRKAFGELRNV